jgi:hypothetical protein
MGSSLSFWGEDLFRTLWLSVHEAMTTVRAITMSVSRTDITQLQQIPNVGPSIAANLRLIGVTGPQDLLGKDPYVLYEQLCRTTGTRHDPCVIDVFITIVRFMAGEPAQPWWKYTAERKEHWAARTQRNP